MLYDRGNLEGLVSGIGGSGEERWRSLGDEICRKSNMVNGGINGEDYG